MDSEVHYFHTKPLHTIIIHYPMLSTHVIPKEVYHIHRVSPLRTSPVRPQDGVLTRSAGRQGPRSCEIWGTIMHRHHAWAPCAPCIGTVYRLIAVRIRWIRIPGWSAFTLGSAICVKRIALPRRQRTSHNHNSIFCAVFVCDCSIKGIVRRYYST